MRGGVTMYTTPSILTTYSAKSEHAVKPIDDWGLWSKSS